MTLSLSLPIATEQAQVKEVIMQFSRLPDEPLNRIADASLAMGGKQLRATLLLLASKLYGPISSQVIQMAALAEIIHTATLIHDDVFDNAMTRRGRPSMNQQWGSEIALLYGDYLLCQVFISMYEIQPVFVKYFSETLRNMCVGEILETMHRYDINMTEDLYLSMIEKKTASLFSRCCSIGPILQGADKHHIQAMSRFGLEAGMAFQIMDDILDLTGISSILGKPVVHDIGNGKLTLPVIHALRSATVEERSFISNAFANRTLSKEIQERLNNMMERYKGLEHARNIAKVHLDRAKNILVTLPDNEIRQAMGNTVDIFLQRCF